MAVCWFVVRKQYESTVYLSKSLVLAWARRGRGGPERIAAAERGFRPFEIRTWTFSVGPFQRCTLLCQAQSNTLAQSEAGSKSKALGSCDADWTNGKAASRDEAQKAQDMQAPWIRPTTLILLPDVFSPSSCGWRPRRRRIVPLSTLRGA